MQSEQRVSVDEAISVRPWIKIPYIARVYDVSEHELFRTLDLSPADRRRRAPLQVLARQEVHDLNADTAALNATINTRRAAPTTPQRTP